jgi:uncharacterized protein YcbK (DUF882 family)
MSISRKEILMGREVAHPLDAKQEANLTALLKAVNVLRKAYGKPMHVTSGYRPAAINAKVGGAKRSAHLTCEAVDFADSEGKLKDWCMANLDLLIKAGLYMEHPDATPGWCHVQTRPTKNRVFKP